MPTALPPSSDFTGAGVTEGGFKSAITALRDYLNGLVGSTGGTAVALSTLGAPLSGVATKTGAYSVVAGDKGKLIDCSGTWTLSLLAAATAADGFNVSVKNSGSGVVTIDPNSTETVDGGATLALNAGESLILYCTGSAWLAVGKASGVPSGAMTAFGGASAPAGWLLCDGSAVSRTTYASLFAAIATTFGTGDGSSTFNLPDLRGRALVGKDNMGGSAANRITAGGCGITGTTLGATGGAETHALTSAQNGAHTHGFTAVLSSAVNSEVFQTNGTREAASASAGTTDSSGSGTAHNNVQPSLIANVIIKT